MTDYKCDDCGKIIDVSHLGKKREGDRFVCDACKRPYAKMEKLIAMLERQEATLQ
jgi:DNA-directed RNA polymerase subunit RPC12/RpoP